MLQELLNRHWFTLHSGLVALGLCIYFVASHARRQRRHPSAAIAWVISLALLPYVALPLYLLIGSRKVGRNPRPRQLPDTSILSGIRNTPAAGFQNLAAAMGLARPTGYEALVIHENGQAALESLRQVIKGASHTLDVGTFLLGRDVLGREVIELLAARAEAGVRVRLLIDGIGAYLGGRPSLRRLTAAGAQVALFVSPLQSTLPGRTNLRNHRKLVVADGVRIWSGGRNLAAEYFVGDPNSHDAKAPWVDLSFELRGDIAAQVLEQFNRDWAFAKQLDRLALNGESVHTVDTEKPVAQLIASGPDQSDDTLYSLLISSCFTAQTRIVAVTPYFVPEATLLMALTLAARRGVHVDLLLPQRSNHRLADMVRHAALREMSLAGASVWLSADMVHAKAFVVDDTLALAGSANLDERSLFLNYEMMIAFYDPSDVRLFAQWIVRQRSGAVLYEAHPPGVLRVFAEGFLRLLAFQL